MLRNRIMTLQQRPVGSLKPTDFSLATQAIPEPDEGEFLVRVHYCSLDPATRRWMDEDSYGASIPLGGGIACLVVGQIIASRCDTFPVNRFVMGLGQVADYVIMRPATFTRLVPEENRRPLSNYLCVLGSTGLTAYNGLVKIGQPQPGMTVLVSGAAGGVGSLVGQIARLKGCRVVGIAGGADKGRELLTTFGFDGAVDYQGKDLDALSRAIQAACPDGVDIFFDNVGGAILDAALTAINDHANLVLCGMISQYNREDSAPGPRHIWQLVAKNAHMHGFLNRHYSRFFDEAFEHLNRWVDQDQLVWREHIEQGLENFYEAYIKLFTGANKGKLMLQI